MTSRRKGDNPETNWTPEEYEFIDRVNKENMCIHFRRELLYLHKHGGSKGSHPNVRKALVRTGLLIRRHYGRGYTNYTLTDWALAYMKL